MDNSERPEDMFINDPAQAEAMKRSSPYVAMFEDYMKKGDGVYKDIPTVGQVPEMSGVGQLGGVPEVPTMFKRMEKSREVKHWEQKLKKEAMQDELSRMDQSQLLNMLTNIEKAIDNKSTKRVNMKKQKAMIKSFSPDLRKALLHKGMSVQDVEHIEKEFKTNLPPEAIDIMNSYVDTAVRKGWGGAAVGGLLGAGGGPLGIALGAYIGHKLGEAVGRGQISSKQAKVAKETMLQRSQNELTSQKIVDKALQQYLHGTAAAGGPAAPPSVSQQILGRVLDRFLPPKTPAAPAASAGPTASTSGTTSGGTGSTADTGTGSTTRTGVPPTPNTGANAGAPPSSNTGTNAPPPNTNTGAGSSGAARWQANVNAGLKRQQAAQKAAQTRAAKPKLPKQPQQQQAAQQQASQQQQQQASQQQQQASQQQQSPKRQQTTKKVRKRSVQQQLRDMYEAQKSPKDMIAFARKNKITPEELKSFFQQWYEEEKAAEEATKKMMKGEVSPMKPQSPIELKKAIFSVNKAIEMIKKEAPWTKEDPSMSPHQEQSGGGEEKDIKWLSHALEGGGLDSLSKHPVVGENIGNAADKVGSKFLDKIQSMGKEGSFDHADPKAIGLAILESIDGMANDSGDEKIGKAWTGAMASLIDKYGKKVVADVAQGLAQEGAGQFRKAVAEPIGPSHYPAKNKKTAKTDFGGQSEVYGDGTNMDTESLTENSKLLETE